MPDVSSSASQSELTTVFATVQLHFQQVIVPLWLGPGWNPQLALPYEAVNADHQPLPPQRYRAMACARQLYLFSSLIDNPAIPEAKNRAALLFRSLQQHFHDAEHGAGFTALIHKASRWIGAKTCTPTPSSFSPVPTTGPKCASRWWSRYLMPHFMWSPSASAMVRGCTKRA